MDFVNFAKAHGLIIDSVLHNRWVATPTEDHPRKRNGRYKLLGDVGWVQNWATMQRPAMWKSEGSTVDLRSMRADLERARRERFAQAKEAADKAKWILSQTKPDTHPYLASKGFEKEVGNVWKREDGRILVIPMFKSGRLTGCQMIDEQGSKQFLRGQATKGASFVFDAKGLPIFCEGFATGLSIRAAMMSMRVRFCIHVCFSAGNLQEVARHIHGGMVVADHDLHNAGEKAAAETGKPYWLSPTVGEDFNDFHRRVGLFSASQALKSLILKQKKLETSSAEQIRSA